MSRYCSIILVAFLLVGCSTKEVIVTETTKKVFEEEDNLILQALHFHEKGEYAKAKALYHELYERSQKRVYLIEEATLAFMLNDAEALKIIQEGRVKFPEEPRFLRLLVGQHLKDKAYEEAEKVLLKLLSQEKSAQNLTIAGNLYLQTKAYNVALKYFESAYKEQPSEELMLNIADLLHRFLGRKEDAIAYLETYTAMEGCGKASCIKLIELYGKERNIRGVIASYKKIYKERPNPELGKKIVELLLFNKQNKEAIRFLEEEGHNQELLLQIYVTQKRFLEAYDLASSLYQQSRQLDYLGKMAIYEYELHKEKLTPTILASISKKFEEVTALLRDGVFLNYYGYLLIDHDLDIAKGIALVERALEMEPNSPYYLDSLAWGLYKQGKCAQAYEIMKHLEESVHEEEVMEHIKAIQKCLKEKP